MDIRGAGPQDDDPVRLVVAEAAFQVVPFARHVGWMTGRVVYRDVWWEYDAAGLR